MVLWFSFLLAPSTTVMSSLSLHDALPISFAFALSAAMTVGTGLAPPAVAAARAPVASPEGRAASTAGGASPVPRSEEHTSELQSRFDLVCRLLLEKKHDGANDRPAPTTSQ